MPYLSLADLLEDLERDRQLVRINSEVESDLEIAEISRRCAQRQGPALLFTRVRGKPVPLVTNLLHSEPRLCRALGVDSLAALSNSLAELHHPNSPSGWMDMLKLAPGGSGGAKHLPRSVRTGPCQQVVRLASDVNLSELPLLRSWPDDEAAGTSAGLLAAQSPDDNRHVLEPCRAQVLDARRLAVDWPAHRGAAQVFAECLRRGEPMNVALVLGSHPLDPLAAITPLGPRTDAWTVAGFLRGKSVDLVKGRTIDLDVPADAEVIVEGQIDPAAPTVAMRTVGDFSGSYGAATTARVMQVTAITQRANAVCLAMVPGPPPHELGVLRKAMQRLVRPLVQALLPEVVDYTFPDAGGCEQVSLVAIRKTYPHQARRVAGALWALEPWMFSRLLVLVDEEVDLSDAGQVLHTCTSLAAAGRDLFIQRGPAGELLGIDATRKLPGEHSGPGPAALVGSKQIADLVSGRWAEYGLP